MYWSSKIIFFFIATLVSGSSDNSTNGTTPKGRGLFSNIVSNVISFVSNLGPTNTGDGIPRPVCPSTPMNPRPCIPRDFNKGSVVCVCNSTYCDSVSVFSASEMEEYGNNPTHSSKPGERRSPVQVFTSTKTGSRFYKTIVHFNNDPDTPYKKDDLVCPTDSLSGNSILKIITKPVQNILGIFDKPTEFSVERIIQYQTVLGYGGAFTDAAGINIGALSEPARVNLMKSYFGNEGIDYSMGRVPIGGCDFSTRPYTYDDDVDDLGGSDESLKNFKLQPEDFNLKIPYIKWAQQLSGNKIKLLASPWSAPAWMKTKGKIHGQGLLRIGYWQSWAEYFVKFIKSYKDNNVDIWGVTTQNEPADGLFPFFPFNSMGWTASMTKGFVLNNLGPTLATAGLNTRVIILDDNKDNVMSWGAEILDNPDSAKYVHGIGTHWYFDFKAPKDILTRFHKKYPDSLIIQTEACLGFAPWELEKVSIGNWERGEKYLEAIIHDSNNYINAWLDWNLALHLNGGPNWANLKADAAILVNADDDEFFKQPIYYGIGHVSKFVPADSKRIEMAEISVSSNNIKSVAFLRPDNGIVVVLLNKHQKEVRVTIRDSEKGILYFNLPPDNFQTLLYY